MATPLDGVDLVVNLSNNEIHVTRSQEHEDYFKDKLKTSFQRTVRVANNASECELPPDLGAFPLYSVDDHIAKLPRQITLNRVFFCNLPT